MERNISVPAFGGASLLAAFGIVCILTFSLLSLGTVQAEKRLSDSAISSVSAYYEADRAAEEIFARLRAGELPDGVTKTGTVYTYTCPISHSRQLFVRLEQADTWQVHSWQVRVSPAPETDDHLPVWAGE